jgi:hypothetical protein
MRLLAILALAFIITPAAAQDMPARKAGLWEMKMTFEGRGMPPQVMQHCTDAATDKAMQEMGGNMRADMCSKRDIKQVGNTIVMDSVCNMGGATTTSHGVVTGDFNSAYTIKISSKREGGAAAPGMPAETQMSIEAKWTGPCKADQKPGDIIMGNGMKMNINNMPNAGAPGGVKK